MDGIERSSCQEVEGAEDTQVDPMMLERLVGEVSDIEPDRVRPELQSNRHIQGSNSEVCRPVTGDRLELDPQAMSRTA